MIKRLAPTFDPKDHGYASFSEMLKVPDAVIEVKPRAATLAPVTRIGGAGFATVAATRKRDTLNVYGLFTKQQILLWPPNGAVASFSQIEAPFESSFRRAVSGLGFHPSQDSL